MKKSPILALILSIIPGLGHIYVFGLQNSMKRLLAIWGTIGVSIWFCIIGIGFIMIAIVWIFAALDAMGQAVKINKENE